MNSNHSQPQPPDFSKYSKRELEEALTRIDAIKFPLNFELLRAEIELRKSGKIPGKTWEDETENEMQKKEESLLLEKFKNDPFLSPEVYSRNPVLFFIGYFLALSYGGFFALSPFFKSIQFSFAHLVWIGFSLLWLWTLYQNLLYSPLFVEITPTGQIKIKTTFELIEISQSQVKSVKLVGARNRSWILDTDKGDFNIHGLKKRDKLRSRLYLLSNKNDPQSSSV